MNTYIEDLYDVFSVYPIKPKIDGCPCCVTDSNERPLHSKELRMLSWDDLQVFIFKTMTTFGDKSDFKHFLPRIFELYVTDYYGAPYDIGVLFSKLDYARWQEWPLIEKGVLEKSIVNWQQQLHAKGEDAILDEIKQNMLAYEFTMP